VSESSSKLVVAEVTSAIAALLGLCAAGGSRTIGWFIHRRTKADELAEQRRQVMEHFDRFERWCARVDEFMARSTEHRMVTERFMARADVAFRSVAQRIGRLERVQDHAA
jgi:hypothetical protein